ncbi:MAG: hypothetical protein OXF79_19345 [Chloroflexi bacterium]|nr:hypothetical protein [Chloroflexota bacterium]
MIDNREHADLGRLIADYEATHERVQELRARMVDTASIWISFASMLSQNPLAVRGDGDTVSLGDESVIARADLDLGQVLREVALLREVEAHERDVEHRLDEAGKHYIVEGLKNRRVDRDVPEQRNPPEQRDLMSRRA